VHVAVEGGVGYNRAQYIPAVLNAEVLSKEK
jgi:hypothetical protein